MWPPAPSLLFSLPPSFFLLFLFFSPHLFIKLMRLKLGPSSQGERERAKEDTQARGDRDWRESVSMCTGCVLTWVCHLAVQQSDMHFVRLYAGPGIHRGVRLIRGPCSSVPLRSHSHEMAHSPAAQHAPLFIRVRHGAVMSVPSLRGFFCVCALGYLPVTKRKRGERFHFDRFSAELGWSCDSNKSSVWEPQVSLFFIIIIKQKINTKCVKYVKYDTSLLELFALKEINIMLSIPESLMVLKTLTLHRAND